MSAGLQPEQVCRACWDPLPFDTHDGLCTPCRYLAAQQRCPECAAGKHGNCDGTAWCPVLELPVACACHTCDPFTAASRTGS